MTKTRDVLWTRERVRQLLEAAEQAAPGPWYVDLGSEDDHRVSVVGDAYNIAKLDGPGDGDADVAPLLAWSKDIARAYLAQAEAYDQLLAEVDALRRDRG